MNKLILRFFIVYVTVLAILLSVLCSASGCSSFGTSAISECRKLCQGQKVDRFKDESSECRCLLPNAKETTEETQK